MEIRNYLPPTDIFPPALIYPNMKVTDLTIMRHQLIRLAQYQLENPSPNLPPLKTLKLHFTALEAARKQRGLGQYGDLIKEDPFSLLPRSILLMAYYAAMASPERSRHLITRFEDQLFIRGLDYYLDMPKSLQYLTKPESAFAQFFD